MLNKLVSTHKGRHISALSSWFVVMAVSVTYLIYISASSNILPDKEVAAKFTKTQCLIVSKKINVKKQFFKHYRADFLISYEADHVQYRRWVSGNGLDQSFVRNAETQDSILTRYHVGGEYPCYFNPNHPETAVLVLRHDWGSIVPMVIASGVGLVALFYFIKNMIMLINMSRRSATTPVVPEKQPARRKHRLRKHK